MDNEKMKDAAIGYITLRQHFIKKTDILYKLSMEYIDTKNQNLLDNIKELRNEKILKYGYPDFIKDIIVKESFVGLIYKGYKLRDNQLNYFIYEKI